MIQDFSIPIPPLPIQREIVQILDNFTELTAELTARKKQYEYYRDTLLTFGVHRGGHLRQSGERWGRFVAYKRAKQFRRLKYPLYRLRNTLFRVMAVMGFVDM